MRMRARAGVHEHRPARKSGTRRAVPLSLRATLAAATLGPLWGWACTLTFPCSTDAQCTRDGATGVCQASGYCSFPDASCDSNQRYGELAPGELAGLCVPTAEGSESDTATGDDPTTGASTVGPVSTDGLDGPTTVGGTDDPSSTDTGEPACCHAGCEGTCDSMCAPQQIGGPAVDQEAIGVAVVGEFVVWSTGFGRSLEISSMAAGAGEPLAMVRSNAFVTKIAADDVHVYFLDYGGPSVKRASVPEGVVDVVTVVDGGMANFGGIAVGADHVYFAMRATGDIWRAAKDLSDQDGAELVAIAGNPFDVALDDTAVYWIDNADERIWRLALDQIGGGEAGTVIYQGSGLGTLTVDPTHVYFGDGSSIGRAVKDGQDEGIETLATEQGTIWDIAVDETHVYWTSSGNGELARVPLSGGEVEGLAQTPTPWGLDLGCQAAFWAENGTQTLQMVPK
jgi:hypothetical protein